MGTETSGDPESFVIGGPTLTAFFVVFFLDEEVEDPNTTNRGPSSARQRNVSLLCG